jgi:hypothetical protein
MDDDSDAVFRPDFDLTQFRHAVARYVKLLVRARWQSEPGFLSESDLQRWKLSDIAAESNPAWQLMREAALMLAELNTNYLPRCGSGGVMTTDTACAVGRLIPTIAFLVNGSLAAGPHHNQPLLMAAGALRKGQEIDWVELVDWEMLASVRDDLDLLPESVSRAKPVPSKVRVTANFPLPEGTKWRDVTLTIVSKDSVKISAAGVSKRFMFNDIGFADGRRRDMPDRRWDLLLTLAQQNGNFTWKSRIEPLHRNRLQSAISEIRERLKQLTGLDEDPFEDYRACKAYRTKFAIRDASFSGESDSPDDSAD